MIKIHRSKGGSLEAQFFYMLWSFTAKCFGSCIKCQGTKEKKSFCVQYLDYFTLPMYPNCIQRWYEILKVLHTTFLWCPCQPDDGCGSKTFLHIHSIAGDGCYLSEIILLHPHLHGSQSTYTKEFNILTLLQSTEKYLSIA